MDKAKFHRLAVASQGILTQSSEKFAEKIRANLVKTGSYVIICAVTFRNISKKFFVQNA